MQFIVIPAFLLGFLNACESSAIQYGPKEKSTDSKTDADLSAKKISDRWIDVECLSGTEWTSNCHSCSCSELGLAQCVLTSTACLGNDDRTLDPIRCKAGSSYNRDCNTCTCLESGLSSCTIRKCTAEVQAETPTTSAAPPAYVPIATFLPEDSNAEIPLEEPRCAAGTSWKSQCNTCHCSEDGQPSCEKKTCKESIEPIRSCLPESKWSGRCNQCWCDSLGRPFCTRDGCLAVSNLNFDDDYSTSEESQPKTNLAKEQPKDATNQRTGLSAQKDSEPSSLPVIKLRGNFNNQRSRTHQDDRQLRNHHISRDYRQADEELYTSAHSSLTREDVNHNIVRRSVCKPYQNFKQDCNTCSCASDGQSYKCSQNECMEGKEEVDREVEVFMESEGIDHIERHSVCRAFGVFYIGCNTCLCNFDGTDYTCTNKPCPLPEDVELFHELRGTRSSENKTTKPKIVCVANRMFIKDCNTCWCNKDGTSYICTRKVCIHDLPDDAEAEEDSTQDLRIIKESCRPEEVFESDCNLCFCNKDGDSYSCTKKACLTEITEREDAQVDKDDKKSQQMQESGSGSLLSQARRNRRAASQPEPPNKCQPGSKFRLDCNTCLCDNAGKNFSCTRMDCSKPNGNNLAPRKEERKKREIMEQEVGECAPGSVFEQGCSVCRCGTDGKHATCNIRRCSIKNEDNQEQDHKNAVTSESNFRCNPGEQFKRECNDCTCSADGKSVFCTLRFCDVVESTGNV